MSTNTTKNASLHSMMEQQSPEILALFLDEGLSDSALVEALREHIASIMQHHYPKAWAYYTGEEQGEENYYKLVSSSMAYMRKIGRASCRERV